MVATQLTLTRFALCKPNGKLVRDSRGEVMLGMNRTQAQNWTNTRQDYRECDVVEVTITMEYASRRTTT